MKQNCSGTRVNLHTHTAHCRHASGLPADYCAAALEMQFNILGFSDHAPYPDDRFHGSRMFFSELEEYRHEIVVAQEAFPQLKVFAGLEVEYCSDLGGAYCSNYLLGEVGLDYLIGAAHFVKITDGSMHPFYADFPATPEIIRAFIRQTLETMENLPIVYLAHPDGFASRVERMTPELKSGFQDIVALAVERNIPLEINANGVRRGKFVIDGCERYRYPWTPFWEIAAEGGAKVVIGSDAHHPQHLILQYDECEEFAKSFGLPVVNSEIAAEILRKKEK